MASTTTAAAAGIVPASPETLITIKVQIDGSNRKFKLPLHDLGAAVFPDKLRSILQVSNDNNLVLERFSDSHNSFTKLEPENHSAYRQLYRAAKAKLKLRIKATVVEPPLERTVVSKDDKSDDKNQDLLNSSPPSMQLPSMIPMKPFQIPNRPSEFKSIGGAKNITNASARESFFEQLAKLSRDREMGRRMMDAPAQIAPYLWQVFCNNCDKPMVDAHYHCSICDDGDFDLCEACVNTGSLCQGEGHWLIKRFIKNGKVINSTTERLATPRSRSAKAEVAHDVPKSRTSEINVGAVPTGPTRTCNSCFEVLPEKSLVNCTDCDDYDLCMSCHLANKHGHHPGHTFVPLQPEVQPSPHVAALCGPGRNMRHAAICDGCDKSIIGVRHKCLNCPDWDFCDNCLTTARTSHPGHRFVPVYDSLEAVRGSSVRHFGISCDGPLCTGKAPQSYIQGVRYKCAICHDTDFCANCEAHPSNKHNHTHPLLKFKTSVLNVNVTTVGEDKNGVPMHTMGDRHDVLHSARPCSTLPPYSAVDTSPGAVAAGGKMHTGTGDQSKSEDSGKYAISHKTLPAVKPELDAHFLEDSVADGQVMCPGSQFTQTWKLRNPGPLTWPQGCSVRFIGGDYMLDMDSDRPSETQALMRAQESNAAGPVEVGGEFSFTVPMRAPKREGQHISYWRLKTPNGIPFGHKLWCDIQVNSFAQLSPAAQSSPMPGHSSLAKNGQGPPPVTGMQLKKDNALETSATSSGHALIDYQMQLMLLEQINKPRTVCSYARQERLPAHETPIPEELRMCIDFLREQKLPPLIEYNLQLWLRRRDMAKQASAGIANVEEAYTSATESAEVSAGKCSDGVTSTTKIQAARDIEAQSASEVVSDLNSKTSVMVFPTLERDGSPASSTYQDALVAVAVGTSETPRAVTTQFETEQGAASEGVLGKTIEDMESLELEDSDDDDGFMTDEEYDILDASDEEVVSEGKPKA